MKVRLLQDMETKDGLSPMGTVIDHKHAHVLVTIGVAEEVVDGTTRVEAKPAVKGWKTDPSSDDPKPNADAN